MNLSLTSTKLPFSEKELTAKLLTTIDLPLEALNRSSIEKIFGVKLDIINPEAKTWGLPNTQTWYANIDDESVPQQKRQFGFGFDLGHAPDFKDVPLCIQPESIIGHLKSAGWQEHIEPGLPNRKPIVSYTKDNKRVRLNLVGKSQVERQITCVANLSVGAL